MTLIVHCEVVSTHVLLRLTGNPAADAPTVDRMSFSGYLTRSLTNPFILKLREAINLTNPDVASDLAFWHKRAEEKEAWSTAHPDEREILDRITFKNTSRDIHEGCQGMFYFNGTMFFNARLKNVSVSY